MIKIGHAVMDENGKAVGTNDGDQTGKEICIRSWYANNWNVYLECTDKELAKKAAAIMEAICKDASYGYSQPHRWTGYKSIVANGGDIKMGKGDFDCSSLVITCYKLAGLDIKATGYTGNMRKLLLATGKFKMYNSSKYLTSDKYAKVGGIYLKEGSHVVMALEDYSTKPTESKLKVKVDYAKSHNKIYSRSYITTADCNLQSGAGDDKETVAVLPKGTKVRCYGYYTAKESTVWLYVTYKNYTGFCPNKYLS